MDGTSQSILGTLRAGGWPSTVWTRKRRLSTVAWVVRQRHQVSPVCDHRPCQTRREGSRGWWVQEGRRGVQVRGAATGALPCLCVCGVPGELPELPSRGRETFQGTEGQGLMRGMGSLCQAFGERSSSLCVSP